MSFILDDSNTSATTGTFDLRADSSTQELAQLFVPAVTDDIGKVTFKVAKVGSPSGNIFIKIYTDNSGSPGSLLVTSANVNVSSQSTSPTDIDFIFPLGTVLTSGVSYWASLGGDYTIDVSNLARISVRNPHYRADAKKYNGSSWTVTLLDYSHYFLEYYNDSSPSASISPSPSISPSASLSPSISPSASLSPSASRSPSASISPSSSNSPSQSPSSSISASISPSPSSGFADYTRQELSSLPTNNNDLSTFYTVDEVNKVVNEDTQYVDQTGTLDYMIHQFKVFVGNKTTCTIEFIGKSTLAPDSSTAYLQIYNLTSNNWETVDQNNDASANQDFELVKRMPDLTNYKDADNIISCRVYQLAI